MASKASKLGYDLIAMTFQPNCTDAERKSLLDVCKEAHVDVVSRVDLRPRTPRELLNNIRRLRRKFEIVGVVCDSKTVARLAGKDRRVDVLNFPSIDFRRRFFDRAEAELASGALACLEIDARQLLMLEGSDRVKLLTCLRRETAAARQFGVPIILSSGVSNAMFLRKPMEMAALACLFDLDRSHALRMVSENPAGIVKRNKEKLSSRFVAPGIRVVRKGRDC
jgi:RNase P/RNase MRP subunit p30